VSGAVKLLFFMTHAGHARNFESILTELSERGHKVHVALDRYEKRDVRDINDLLKTLCDRHPNLTMGTTPQLSKTEWARVRTRFRATLDLIGYFDAGHEHSDKYRNRAEGAIPSPLRPIARTQAGRSVLRGALGAADTSAPVPSQYQAYIAEQRPDAILVTPLVEFGSPQLDYVRGARAAGIPSALLVHSWDNLTAKGLIHESPDLVAVWNERQKREAVELHHIPSARVAVTGATPYDHWFEWTPSGTQTEFCERLGLDSDKPIVLYVGSSKFITPKEGAFVADWATELIDEQGGTLPEFQILVRPHPTNPIKGRDLERLEGRRNVFVYPPRGANPTTLETRVDYFDSIFHSAAVVGVNTTAFIESAIVNRPVYTLLTPRYRDTQKGSQHFQHLLPRNGGMLNVAASPGQHANQLGHALRGNVADVVERNREFVASFIRPLGVTRPATPFLADAIERLADVQPAPPVEPPLPARIAGVTITRVGQVYLTGRTRRARARKRAGVDPAPRESA
jgi:hypothetical protein